MAITPQSQTPRPQVEAPAALADDLGSFAAGISFEMIPPSGVEFAKALVSKVLAGTLAGSRTPSAKRLAQLLRERRQPEEVGAIGHGFRTSLWDAALLNVFTGHSSELEDVAHSPGGVSWDITVIPLALGLGEKLNLSGKELVESIVAGLEVHYRTCLPFDGTPVGMVLPYTAAMGCAAAAARAQGLDADRTMVAMGFALSSAPMAEVSMGTDAHFFESALHAVQGLIGTELAAAGLTLSPDLTGFDGLRAPGVDLAAATAGLGERWHFEEMWIKKYPLCFLVHRQVDALLELIAEHSLSFDEIESVEVLTGPGDASCDRPNPKTVGDLQFSFQHALGVAMTKGRIGLADVEPSAADDAEYVAARRKVHVTIDESIPFSVSLSEPTEVTVKTADGRELKRERLSAPGSPDEPLSREDFSEMFRDFVGDALATEDVEQTLETIWHLEELADVASLMETLTFPTNRRDAA